MLNPNGSITFYCVGFPDLSHTWCRYGHVGAHKIYLYKEDAEAAAEGLITGVHEFQVRSQDIFNKVLDNNVRQRENLGIKDNYQTWWFTFGSNHVTLTNESLFGCYMCVKAESYEDARKIIFEYTNGVFSFQYDSAETCGVTRFNMKQVPLQRVVRLSDIPMGSTHRG